MAKQKEVKYQFLISKMFLECFTGSLRINKPFYYKNHLGTYHEMHLFVRTKLFPLYVLLAIKLSFSKLLIKYLSTKKLILSRKLQKL